MAETYGSPLKYKDDVITVVPFLFPVRVLRNIIIRDANS